jgi:probable nitrogen fixation protein
MLGDPWNAARGEVSFVRELVRQLRAHGDDSAWDGRTDAELLRPFLVRKGRGADEEAPDPDVFWRIELFHAAVGVCIEARTGVTCTPMLRMHHQGFGRVVLLAGRLVAVNRVLRDAGRFGFASPEELALAGERLVAAGVTLVERYPEPAHLPD